MTKSEEGLTVESDERRETIGLSNLLPPPRPIRDIRVIRGYFLYAGISGSSGGSRRLTTDSTDADLTQKAGIEELDFQGKRRFGGVRFGGNASLHRLPTKVLVVHSHSRGITARPSSSQPAKSDLSQRSLPRCC